VSDDGRHGLTVIAFVGSVFSPYYAWQRRRKGSLLVEPEQHVSINVALYGNQGRRWAMTERGRRDLYRGADELRVGPSALRWSGTDLAIQIDEVTSPWPSRMHGDVILTPTTALNTCPPVVIDNAGRHFWQPISPCARVTVAMRAPDLHWQGTAYWDANFGSEPLQDAVAGWHWSRTHPDSSPGLTHVMYDVARRDGTSLSLAKTFCAGPEGDLLTAEFLPPPAANLPGSRWLIQRQTRSDMASAPRILGTLEDGPFYVRSRIKTSMDGVTGAGVHESLSMDRFRSPWVQMLLPFRMPRRA
jgi:carotenoid 1,2-hydratase